MIADDRWARVTPFEIGLPGRGFATDAFSAIRAEAEERGVDPSDPGAFLQLGEVGRVLRELQGDDRGPELLQRLGSFLFHAFHFHEAGRPTLLVASAVARRLADPGFTPDWGGSLPAAAGYAQLPRHLFWTEDATDTPEPIDGAFWVEARGRTLSLLLATGLRGGRPGFSLVEVPPVDVETAVGLTEARVREDGDDFATTLPGGELDELHSITTLGEAIKLFSRLFALIAEAPELLGPEEQAPDGADREAGALPHSMLPFRRVGPATGSEEAMGPTKESE